MNRQRVVDDYLLFTKPQPLQELSVPVPGSDSWESIFADHCKMIFWRTGWTRAIYNRKPPHLLTKLEEIERRGNRANARIKQIMDRADALRTSNPNSQFNQPELH